MLCSVLAALMTLTAWASPVPDAAGDVPATRVVADDTHEVWSLGTLTVTLRRTPGPDEAPTDPRCRGNGADLFVDGTPSVDEAAALDRVCARLVWDAPTFAPPAPPRVDAPAALPASSVWLARGLALGALLGGLALLPRAPTLWGIAALGLLLRVCTGTPRILMGVAYAYDGLLTYAGLRLPSARYGAGWPALLDVVRPVLGAAPDRLHLLNLGLSTLVVLLVGVAGTAWGDAAAGRRAALVAAVLPLAVWVGPTESPYVVASWLVAVALAGVARGGRVGAAASASAAGLLALVRPDLLPLAASLGVLWLWRRGWAAALVVLTVVGWRALEVRGAQVEVPWPSGPMVDLLLARAVGAGSSTVVLDPWRTPLWLVPLGLAGLGVIARRHGRRLALGLLLVLIAGTAPFVMFHRLTDLARYHLPVQAVWCLLAGLVVLPERRALRWVALVVGLGGLALAARPLGGPLVHAVEHDRLRAVLCRLPAGTRVVYDPARDPDAALARYVEVRCGVALRPWPADGVVPVGTRVWVGVGDRWPGAHPPARCSLRDDDVVSTPAWDGGLEPIGDAPVRVGLATVTACR